MANTFKKIYNKNDIIEFLEGRSQSMANYVKNAINSNFLLIYKMLTHSDLPTFAKRTKNEGTSDNLLYYATTREMDEENKIKVIETAHQSNIGLNNDFFNFLNIPNPRVLVSQKQGPDDFKKLNDYCNVYLVNDCAKYFNWGTTVQVFDKLGKKFNNKKEYSNPSTLKLILNQGDFTPIEISIAVHGIGIKRDTQFNILRHFMFKSDTFAVLLESNKTDIFNIQKNVFIMPIRNQLFFNILDIHNKAYSDYMNKLLQQKENKGISVQTENDIERQFQNRWRNALAEEMMAYTTEDDTVFCPISLLKANFKYVGTIYRASHIKEYKDCSNEEKYDLNNGLLLSANADALFDKHYITISEDKKLLYSFLIDKDPFFKSQLRFEENIFSPILNDKRMKYLEIHRKIFFAEEEKRKHN